MALVALNLPQLRAQEKSAEFRLGVIGPEESGTAAPARQQALGFWVAQKEAEKTQHLKRVNLQIDRCDDHSDPKLTRACAQRLERSGDIAIIGSINSLCTYELGIFAALRHVPVLSPISTATQLTKKSGADVTWFFRAALSDRDQMHWLAHWLVNSRGLQPDEIAFVFEDTNPYVQDSSDESTKENLRDIYGWGLRNDFMEAEPWHNFSGRPIDIGVPRGIGSGNKEQLAGILGRIEQKRRERNNIPIRAIGLLTLWDDARDIISFIRDKKNQRAVARSLGLSSANDLITFAASGATLVDFYREGGPAVVGTYLLSPFFVGESSAPWREFQKILESDKVDSSHPDPYLALGYEAMSLVISCLADISHGNAFSQANVEQLSGKRAAFRACLAQGGGSVLLPRVTGLTGFDKNGEALRNLAQSSYILRVDSQNRLVPPETPVPVPHVTAIYAPDLGRVGWLIIGFFVGCAVSLAWLRHAVVRRLPQAKGKSNGQVQRSSAKTDGPLPGIASKPPALQVPIQRRPDCWFHNVFFFGSDTLSTQAQRTAERACKQKDTTVLILGETGTGKTALARAIAEKSGRMPFQRANLRMDDNLYAIRSAVFGHKKGAYTSADTDRVGLVEAAEGGTVFFDEILNSSLQDVLLDFTQNFEYQRLGSSDGPRRADVRIIAATKTTDLEEAVSKKILQEDLVARLRAGKLVITLPALREHPQDIPEYALGFLERLRKGVCISDELLHALMVPQWHENYRALGSWEPPKEPEGLLGFLCRGQSGTILSMDMLASVPDLPPELTSILADCGIDPQSSESFSAIFSPAFQLRLRKTADPRRRWEALLDAAYNALHGVGNKSFLLHRNPTLRKLSVNEQELAMLLNVSTAEVWESLASSEALLPSHLLKVELTDKIALDYGRELILFAKRSQFLDVRSERLADILGTNRQKLYHLFSRAWALAEEHLESGIVPPASKFIMSLQKGGKWSDSGSATRPQFKNELFEQEYSGESEELQALTRKLLSLQLMPDVPRLNKGGLP